MFEELLERWDGEQAVIRYDAETVVATVTAPMREEEPEEVEGVEGEEGEAALEGEAEEGAEAGAAPEADASADESSDG